MHTVAKLIIHTLNIMEEAFVEKLISPDACFLCQGKGKYEANSFTRTPGAFTSPAQGKSWYSRNAFVMSTAVVYPANCACRRISLYTALVCGAYACNPARIPGAFTWVTVMTQKLPQFLLIFEVTHSNSYASAHFATTQWSCLLFKSLAHETVNQTLKKPNNSLNL